jgi:hypothetical protein
VEFGDAVGIAAALCPLLCSEGAGGDAVGTIWVKGRAGVGFVTLFLGCPT